MTTIESKRKALIVGNGLNLLDSSQSFSWGGLLSELKRKFDIDVDLDNIFKPFPLAFDEMHHLKEGENSLTNKLKVLKKGISSGINSQIANKKGYNEYHTKIASLGYSDILTTNYDYSLELSVDSNFMNLKGQYAVNRIERRFSLKRCYKLKSNKHFWHIHGELCDSRKHSTTDNSYQEESILIGYNHYSSYLEQIQKNVKGKTDSKSNENMSLLSRLQKQQPSPYWIDILFTHDIDIIGQAFDFSENHLWWLLNFRANLIKGAMSRNGVEINNTIRYFYPEIPNNKNHIENDLTKVLKEINSLQKTKAIGEVLKAFNVVLVPIDCDSFKQFYDKAIDRYLAKDI
jgi:hypothetical protein